MQLPPSTLRPITGQLNTPELTIANPPPSTRHCGCGSSPHGLPGRHGATPFGSNFGQYGGGRQTGEQADNMARGLVDLMQRLTSMMQAARFGGAAQTSPSSYMPPSGSPGTSSYMPLDNVPSTTVSLPQSAQPSLGQADLAGLKELMQMVQRLTGFSGQGVSSTGSSTTALQFGATPTNAATSPSASASTSPPAAVPGSAQAPQQPQGLSSLLQAPQFQQAWAALFSPTAQQTADPANPQTAQQLKALQTIVNSIMGPSGSASATPSLAQEAARFDSTGGSNLAALQQLQSASPSQAFTMFRNMLDGLVARGTPTGMMNQVQFLQDLAMMRQAGESAFATSSMSYNLPNAQPTPGNLNGVMTQMSQLMQMMSQLQTASSSLGSLGGGSGNSMFSRFKQGGGDMVGQMLSLMMMAMIMQMMNGASGQGVQR